MNAWQRRACELIGSTVNLLTVLAMDMENTKRGVYMKCICRCGLAKSVSASLLRNKLVGSCGCAKKGNNYARKHGGNGTPEYEAWHAMKSRCYQKSDISFHNYGGRGITVCDDWRRSFSEFIRDMGARPSPEHSVDRIDPNGNYEPGNVRWGSEEEQCNNRRDNRFIEFDGQRLTISQWSRKLGINKLTIKHRLDYGWPPEKALWPKSIKTRAERAEFERLWPQVAAQGKL